MSTKEHGEGGGLVGVELQQMLHSIVQDAVQGAIGTVQQELQAVSSKLSRVEGQLQEQLELDAHRETGINEVGSSLKRLEDQMRGVRARLSDLDSRQRTGQLIGRFVPPPYVADMAHTGAPFRERDQDRSPISPYAQ